MLSLMAQSADTFLQGQFGEEDMSMSLAAEPFAVSMLPTPMIIGLGALLVSAILAIWIERRAEKADTHSAARFSSSDSDGK